MQGPVDLVGRGNGASPAVVVRGGTLDLRQADFGGDSTQDGNDYVETTIASGVNYFKVELLNDAHDPTRLLEITLAINSPSGSSISQSRHLRLEQPR